MSLLLSQTRKREPDYKICYSLFVGFVVIVTCLRKTMLFPDLEGYEYYFYKGELIESWLTTDNIAFLYEWLNSVFRGRIGFQLFISLVSLFIICSYSDIIFKWSPYPLFSIFLFILVNYVPSCFILRQYLAMSICIIAFRFILTRDIGKFLILVIVASGFHITALVVIPLYFLYGINPHKKNLIIIVCISLIVAVFLATFLQKMVPSLLGEYYAHYIEDEGEGSYKRLIMKIFIFIAFLISIKCNLSKDNHGLLYLNFYLMLLSILVCFAGLSIPAFFRLRDYFSLADIIGIPLIVKCNKKNLRSQKILVNTMVFVYVFLLVLSFNNFISDDHKNIHYEFFWL